MNYDPNCGWCTGDLNNRRRCAKCVSGWGGTADRSKEREDKKKK